MQTCLKTHSISGQVPAQMLRSTRLVAPPCYCEHILVLLLAQLHLLQQMLLVL
jgi:hypothetical protein